MQTSSIIYFILSLFGKKEGLKAAQTFHILQGKRTGSTLFQALRNGTLAYYGLFPRLERAAFDSVIQKSLERRALMEREGDRFCLTDRGRSWVDRYFDSTGCPDQIDQSLYGFFDLDFWEKIQLLTQVLSEKAYLNKNYVPMTQSLPQQFWVKKWLYQHESADLVDRFYEEWVYLLGQMEKDQADLISWQLTGHSQIGQTRGQLLGKKSQDKIFLINQIHGLLRLVDDYSSDCPLFYSVRQDAWKENYGLLSKTAYETKLLLAENLIPEEIALRRQVKLGTVSDHLVEIAVLQGSRETSHLYDEEEKNQVLDYLSEYSKKQYKDFLSVYQLEDKAFPFYKYRLIEIEEIQNKYDSTRKEA